LQLSIEIPLPAIKKMIVAKLRSTEPTTFGTMTIDLSGMTLYACEEDLHDDINPIKTVEMPDRKKFWAKLTLLQKLVQHHPKEVDQIDSEINQNFLPQNSSRKRKGRVPDGILQSPIKKQNLDVDFQSVLEQLDKSLSDVVLDNQFCLDETSRRIPLLGREETLAESKEALENLFKYRHSEKDLRPILVFNGRSGIGKSRMLDECVRILQERHPEDIVISRVVSFGSGSGTMLLTKEREFISEGKVQQVLSWRLISSALGVELRFMPQFYENLTLQTFVEMVQEKLSDQLISQRVHLVIGVDEFQRIFDEKNASSLMDCLGQAITNRLYPRDQNFYVYPQLLEQSLMCVVLDHPHQWRSPCL
jgi:hypothetical protein